MLTTPPIASERLDLIAIPPSCLEASIAGDLASASQILGLSIPADWLQQRALMQLRLDQFRANPDLESWLLRAIGVRDTHTMIGHIGFHTQPDPDYLLDIAPGGIEFGYSIFPRFRRQGYAKEACAALMTWAHQTQHVSKFVLSISPTNEPSRRIAEHFGFCKIGTQVDEEDGPEDIFLRDVSATQDVSS